MSPKSSLLKKRVSAQCTYSVALVTVQRNGSSDWQDKTHTFSVREDTLTSTHPFPLTHKSVNIDLSAISDYRVMHSSHTTNLSSALCLSLSLLVTFFLKFETRVSLHLFLPPLRHKFPLHEVPWVVQSACPLLHILFSNATCIVHELHFKISVIIQREHITLIYIKWFISPPVKFPEQN